MRKALKDTRLLLFIAEISMEQGAILVRQYEQMSRHAAEVLRLIGAWIVSDKKRLGMM